jgi:hypothetical protein
MLILKKIYWMVWSRPVRKSTHALRNLYWAIYRWHRKLMHKLINRLIKRYGWHNTVLDSNIPNVRCLKLKSITVVNQYNQEHTHNF